MCDGLEKEEALAAGQGFALLRDLELELAATALASCCRPARSH